MLRFFFNTPKNRSLSPPEALFVNFLPKNEILDPKTDLKNYWIAGVVASGALLKTLLDLLVPYGFVLGPFWKRCWSLLKAFWVLFGSDFR